MIYNKIGLFLTVAVLILIAGCKGSTGPAGPALTGSMTGFVTLVDSAGNYPIDKSGVTVAAQGTSFSTSTDSTGKWTLNGLSTGTYVIVLTKPGYEMTEQQGVELVGGNSPIGIGPFTMAQPTIDSIEFDSITTLSNIGIRVSFTISGKFDSSYGTVCLIVIGRDSSINGSAPNSYIFSTSVGSGPTPSQVSTGISLPSLEDAGFSSGNTAYMVIYPLGYGFSYYDISTGKEVFTSIGTPSKVVKFTIP